MGLAGQTALVDSIPAGEADAQDQLQDCNVTTIRAVAQQLGVDVKLNQPKEDLLSDLRRNINAGITGPPLFPAPVVKCKFVPKAAEELPQESEGADAEDDEGDVSPVCVGGDADGDIAELWETGDADGPAMGAQPDGTDSQSSDGEVSLPSRPDDLEAYSTRDAIVELDDDKDNAVAPAIREDAEMEMDENADDAVAPAMRADAEIQAPGRDKLFGEADAGSAGHLQQEHAPLHQHTTPQGPVQRVQPPRNNKGPATPTTAMPDIHPTIHIQHAADTPPHGACLKAVGEMDAKFWRTFNKGLLLGLPSSATPMVKENVERMVAGLCQFEIVQDSVHTLSAQLWRIAKGNGRREVPLDPGQATREDSMFVLALGYVGAIHVQEEEYRLKEQDVLQMSVIHGLMHVSQPTSQGYLLLVKQSHIKPGNSLEEIYPTACKEGDELERRNA